MLAGFTAEDAAPRNAARMVANVSSRFLADDGLAMVKSSMVSSSRSMRRGAHPAGVFCTDGGRSTRPLRGCAAREPASDRGASGKVLASRRESADSVAPSGSGSSSSLSRGIIPSAYIRTFLSMSSCTSGAHPGGNSSVIVRGPALGRGMYRTDSVVSLVACQPARFVNRHRWLARSVRGSRSARPHRST